VEIVQHPSEESLEQFAMATLPNSETGPLEEHLLICGECRERLDSEIEYVTAMRAAASDLVDVGVNGSNDEVE
jgi:hypothetical protein